MIRLHGFAVSNYYNVAKTALLEAGVEFEEVRALPSQDESFLAISPMGKVPVLEVDGAYIAETSAIVEYIAEAHGGGLWPQEPVARASARQVARSVELYIDLAARPCFAEAFFGGSVSDEVKDTARRNLSQGLRALRQVATFDPYIAGPAATAADYYAYFSIPLAAAVARQLLDWDITAELPGYSDWTALMEERASIQAVNSARG